MMSLIKLLRGLFCVTAACAWIASAAVGQSDTPVFAPVNPELITYLQRKQADPSYTDRSPEPITLPKPSARAMAVQSSESLPAKYNLRTLGKVTPCKDQGQCNSCWAFATCACLESILLPGETWDFSGIGP